MSEIFETEVSYVNSVSNMQTKKLYNCGVWKENRRKTGAPAAGDTILNMVTMSRSLDIPKVERSRYFSEADIISAGCGFSACTYLYRIFKLKEGCTPTEWWEKMAENIASEDKTGLTIFSRNNQESASRNENIR